LNWTAAAVVALKLTDSRVVLGDVIDQEDYVGSYYNRDSLSTIHVRCEPAPLPQQAAAGDGDGEGGLGAGSDESSSSDMPKLLIRSESGPADFIADWQEDDDDEWLGDEDTEVSNSAPPPFLPFPISSFAKLRLFTKTGSGQTVRKEIPRYKRAFVSHTRAGE
jgi:hypothetical protein